ncbi:hypothetical protein ABZV25_02225 [Micrococcus luteus]
MDLVKAALRIWSSWARVWLGAAGLDSLDDAAARQELTGRAPRWGRLLRKVVPRIERASCALAGR